MAYDLRMLQRDDVALLHEAMSLAFHFDPKDDWKEELAEFLEWDRTFGVFDGDDIVGTGGIITFDIAVPGGSQQAGGLTIITVRPTHRRRGILTQMMRHHLRDGQDRGESLAILHASEAVIYERFGYGLAIEPVNYKLDSRHAALRPRSPAGWVGILPADKAIPSLRAVYDAMGTHRPGWVGRDEERWSRRLGFDPESVRDGFTRRLIAVYEEDGDALGYVDYRTKGDWTDDVPQGTVNVNELVGTTADARWALWNYVFSLDLIQNIRAHNRPSDDPLPMMLVDRRRLHRTASEGIWARLIDIPAALSARRYAGEGSLVIEVADSFMPETAGRFLLRGGPDGADCTRTDAPADLVVDVADLGAWYLGGASPSRYGAAGRVQGSAAALAVADSMFIWHPAPWCIHYF